MEEILLQILAEIKGLREDFRAGRELSMASMEEGKKQAEAMTSRLLSTFDMMGGKKNG